MLIGQLEPWLQNCRSKPASTMVGVGAHGLDKEMRFVRSTERSGLGLDGCLQAIAV